MAASSEQGATRGDRRAVQDTVDGRPEAHEASAQIERFHREAGQDRVVERLV